MEVEGDVDQARDVVARLVVLDELEPALRAPVKTALANTV